MKNKMNITGMFNDFFTGYKNKESSITFEVDTKKYCSCGKSKKRCLIHETPSNYKISDI